MMSKMVLKTMVVAALLVTASLVFAQPCPPNTGLQLRPGESLCIQVCDEIFAYPAIKLIGDYYGSDKLPILTLAAGCNAANTDCDLQCNPVVPPSWPFELGGGPWGEPDQYFGESDCFWMYLYHGHDNIWWLEIYALCDGCFCLSYDYQLPVRMSEPLTAAAGDREVALRWATASENNLDRFEILRNGEAVSRIAGQGSSATGHSYTWMDETVQNDIEYAYTLESVSLDGTHEILGTVNATPSENGAVTVTEFALHQNYPNPFNPLTRISFDVPVTANVTLKVYNPMGAAVATLMNGEVGAGKHWVDFDGSSLTSGLYFYTIQTNGGFSATRKMLLVK